MKYVLLDNPVEYGGVTPVMYEMKDGTTKWLCAAEDGMTEEEMREYIDLNKKGIPSI